MSAVTIARVVDTAELRLLLEGLHSRIQATIVDQRTLNMSPESHCEECAEAGCPPQIRITWERPADEPDVDVVVGAECAWKYLIAEVLPFVTTESPVVTVEIGRWTVEIGRWGAERAATADLSGGGSAP